MNPEELETIRRLVGEVSREQLRNVESFVGRRIAVFVPAVGPCLYALIPAHSHPAYSFFLSFGGGTLVSAEGRIIRPEPGLVMAVDPGAEHHELAADEPPRYVAIFIERGMFEEQARLYSGNVLTPFRYRQFTPGPELMMLLKDFMSEAEATLPGRKVLLDAIGVRIAHSLLRSVFAIQASPGLTSDRIEIHRVTEYLHANYGDKVTVTELARIAAMSTAHFSRIFHRETGHSPLDYLIRIRLQKARLLLRNGGQSITDIAIRCGFSSSSHFAACFRRRCGVSPSRYLKSLRTSE